MAAKRITVHRPAIPNPPALRRHPYAYMLTDTGLRFHIPFAPVHTDIDGNSRNWDVINRPGRVPIVRYAGGNARVLSFDFLVEAANGTHVEGTLNYLDRIAKGGHRITLAGMSKREAGPWRMDDMKISVQKRQHGSNAITSAVVSVKLVEALDVHLQAKPVGKGPVSGGVKKAPVKRPAVKKRGSAGPRYYVVRSGDSLWKIALKFYGDAEKWPQIARANPSIRRHPSRLKRGMRLVIPPK